MPIAFIFVLASLALSSMMLSLMVNNQPDYQVLRAQAAALSVAAYRSGAQGFVKANPAFSGTASDAQLAAYLPYGYTKNFGWTNTITSGHGWVYTTDATIVGKSSFSAEIIEQSNFSLLSGVKGANGNLFSARAGDLGIAVPAAVPVGSPAWYF